MTSLWHLPQDAMTSSLKPTRSVRRIRCAEWQSSQTGSGLFDFETSAEWMLFLNFSSTPLWQRPQVSGCRSGLTVESGSLAGRTPCAVWHEVHVALTTRPLERSPLPWIDSVKFSMIWCCSPV